MVLWLRKWIFFKVPPEMQVKIRMIYIFGIFQCDTTPRLSPWSAGLYYGYRTVFRIGFPFLEMIKSILKCQK